MTRQLGNFLLFKLYHSVPYAFQSKRKINKIGITFHSLVVETSLGNKANFKIVSLFQNLFQSSNTLWETF